MSEVEDGATERGRLERSNYLVTDLSYANSSNFSNVSCN